MDSASISGYTFLFTDIEDSTRLWETQFDLMRALLRRHDALLHAAVAGCGGTVFKTVGDAFCAVFPLPQGPLDAALTAQRGLHCLRDAEAAPDSPPPLRVRMALHCGTAEERDGDYFGPTLNRISRLLKAGHGGQVLLSRAARERLAPYAPGGVSFRDLGTHRLRDLSQPEQIFQAECDGLPARFPALCTLENQPGNFAMPLTSFVGRGREMGRIRELLAGGRALTLTGTGGCGKSRLALQTAFERAEQYPDGVWLVELAALSDPALIPHAAAQALSVAETPGRDVLDSLLGALRDRRMLLVLDNCEHLIGACAGFASVLLRRCPGVTLLATSREPLNIEGERTFRVPSLALPGPDAVVTPRRLLRWEAARLFVERAEAARAGFAVTPENAPAVAEICRRLDGIPFALELAAARVRGMTPQEIAARLHQAINFPNPVRGESPRRQTLRAMIDWSRDLLDGPERVLMRRLSVFAGGWTVEAAEAVCAGDGVAPGDVPDLLAALTEKSLVQTEAHGGRTRCRFLEVVREYAREKLSESGEVPALRARHRDFFLAWAEGVEDELYGGEQGRLFDAMEADHDNLRLALAWCEERGDAGTELRLAAALGRFWDTRGHIREAGERLAGALARGGGSSPERARALIKGGWLAYLFRDFPLAEARYDEALEFYRGRGELAGESQVLHLQGILARARGEMVKAQAVFENVIEINNRLGVTSVSQFTNLAGIAYDEGRYALAHSLFLRSLKEFREMRAVQFAAFCLRALGRCALREGELDGAHACFAEGLREYASIGALMDVAVTLLDCAELAGARGFGPRAARLWGAAEGLSEAHKLPLPPEDRDRLNAAKCAPEFRATERRWNEGRAMTPARAVAFAASEKP